MLTASLDFPRVYLLRPQPVTPLRGAVPMVSTSQDLFLSIAQGPKEGSGNSQSASRIDLIRFVDGEYARVVQALPADKHGFHYTVGKPLDSNQLRYALARGSAANPGDQVQVTNIEFHEKSIVVSINGGTKRHFDLRQHLQISVPGAPVASTTPVGTAPSRVGAELVLEFGKRVPELTPDELKHDLAPFLDFAGQHSSAVNWVDTLPPEFRQAIKNHTAITGMNHDMVLAALGRPDQKIREFDENGRETEDWVYGHPPEKTVLVTFMADKVIRIKSYN